MEMNEQALIKYAANLYQHQQDRNETWNGRQVMNAFQNAVALASFSAPSNGRPKLTTAHFQRISDAYENLSKIQHRVVHDSATDHHPRPSINSRRDSFVAPRSRSGLDSPSDNEHSLDAESLSSVSPALHRGYFRGDHSAPLRQEPNLPAAQPQPYVYHQPNQNPASTFQLIPPPQQTTNSWPPQMQQPAMMPAGMLYGMQTQQPWTMPMPPQQQSPFLIPSTAPQVYYQGQDQPNPQLMPMQTAQQQGINVTNPGTLLHPPPLTHYSSFAPQQYSQSDVQPPSSHQWTAPRHEHTQKKPARKSRRPESEMSQGSRQPRQPFVGDDEGFWSRLKR